MSSSYTPNYQLNQWEAGDRVLRTEFNEDNAKIDEALHTEASARSAAEKEIRSTLAKKGNCSIGFLSYSGNGQYGASSPTVISFPRKPAAFFVIGYDTIAAVWGSSGAVNYNGGTSNVSVSWSGAAASITTGNGLANWQLNARNVTYYVLALYDMS